MQFIIKILFITIICLGNYQNTSSEIYTDVDQDTELTESQKRGKEIYSQFCQRCHKTDGKGSKAYPPLAGSDWLVEKKSKSLHAIKYGLKGPISVNGKSYKRTMAKPNLNDKNIADVMNYITNSWGNVENEIFTIEDVSAISK